MRIYAFAARGQSSGINRARGLPSKRVVLYIKTCDLRLNPHSDQRPLVTERTGILFALLRGKLSQFRI